MPESGTAFELRWYLAEKFNPTHLASGSGSRSLLQRLAAGSQDRDTRLALGEGHVIIPEWMTPKQVEAVNALYRAVTTGHGIGGSSSPASKTAALALIAMPE